MLLPGLVVIAGLAVLIGLGVWQLERLGWKEGLIATLDRRLSAAPTALPPAAEVAAGLAAGFSAVFSAAVDDCFSLAAAAVPS